MGADISNCKVHYPTLRSGVDVFWDSSKSVVTFVFLSSRKRISIRALPEACELLVQMDGTRSVEQLVASTSPFFGLVDFVNYLTEKGIVHERDWQSTLPFPPQYVARLQKQLAFFQDLLGSTDKVVEAQTKIFEARVTLLGVGSVGSWLLWELAMMGFRKFNLIDYKTFDSRSSARHFPSGNMAPGSLKAEVYASELRNLDPCIDVSFLQERLRPDSDLDRLFQSCDLIVNSADEPYLGATSLLLSRYCIRRNKILFVAGGFDAHLGCGGELIIPGVTPCADCYSNHFNKALAGWKPSPHPSTARHLGMGGLASLTVFAASSGALEILKYYAGLPYSNGERAELLFGDYSAQRTRITPDPNCRFCQSCN